MSREEGLQMAPIVLGTNGWFSLVETRFPSLELGGWYLEVGTWRLGAEWTEY
jgi:hypothetical protein